MGVSSNLHKILTSFLTDRFQQVVINNVLSDSKRVISGVPQGSVIGPVLFILYINDLPDVFPDYVTSNFFADDVKLYTEIATAGDIDNLQLSIDPLVE